MKKYLTNCVSANGHDINEMVDNARDITRRTFLRHVDRKSLDELAESLGYAKNHKQGLTMASDWCVSYYKGKYRNRPCVFISHSAIEYIFA